MSAEIKYLVRQNDSAEREYRLYELTWLWRTAALPHDAEFRDASGVWRPVRELIDPILEKQMQAAAIPDEVHPAASRPARSHPWLRWTWLAAAVVVLLVAFPVWPEVREKYRSWKTGKIAERETLEKERRARMDDFIGSNYVVPGMTPEEVRRTIGPPRSVKATGDSSLQRWIYRKQIIVFENGKAIGVEASEGTR